MHPILCGFNPDPSICKVEDIYYLVTSTFEFFPGLPIYASTDLITWELVSHVVYRQDQFSFDKMGASRGLFAPTIRFHKGTFYVTVCDVTEKGNCMLTSTNILGPWSDPMPLAIEGIDPSLFFDDDDRCYLTTNANVDGRNGIALVEIDAKTGNFISSPISICAGAGGRYPEAPHLYKINTFYYLLLGEGGTEYGHCVTLFRSNSITGPYESSPSNPILSHRDKSDDPFQCTGHADVFQDADDVWWAVFLATRPLEGVLLHNLGRETFLSPLRWDENGWFIIEDRSEMQLSEVLRTRLPLGFDDKRWLHCRIPEKDAFSSTEKPGELRVRGNGKRLTDDKGNPSFAGIRQAQHNATFKATLKVDDKAFEAGLTAYYNDQYHYALVVDRNEQGVVRLRSEHCLHGILYVVSEEVLVLNSSDLVLEIVCDQHFYRFFCMGKEMTMGKTAALCTEGTQTMTFTGVLLGLFAVQGTVVFSDVVYSDEISLHQS